MGEGDPAVPSLKESLRQAWLQAKVLPVEDRIEGKEARWCIARGSQSGAVDRPGDRGQVGFGGKCPSRWRVAVADIGAGSPRNARTTPDSSSGFCTRIGAIEILCAGIHTGEGRSPIRIIVAWFGREAEEDHIGGRVRHREAASAIAAVTPSRTELTRQARRSEEVFLHSDRGRQVEHDLVGNPEVPATEVDPTALGFCREDGSGRPLASGRALDPESMRVECGATVKCLPPLWTGCKRIWALGARS